MNSNELIDQLFAISSDIRYVALRVNSELTLRERAALAAASSSESDKYEELLVNPTLLTLLQQRGNIDCGGLEFVLIRYGKFFQFVHPLPGGHISIAIEASAKPLELIPEIRKVLAKTEVRR